MLKSNTVLHFTVHSESVIVWGFFRLTQISPPIFKCSRESQCQSWQFWSDRVGPHFSTFTACMTVVRVGGVQTHEGPCQKTSEWWQFTSACLQTAEWQCWKIHPLTINTFFSKIDLSSYHGVALGIWNWCIHHAFWAWRNSFAFLPNSPWMLFTNSCLW